MSDIVILTSQEREGAELKQRLLGLDAALKDTPVLTKETIVPNNDCKYIFSTWYMPPFSQDEIQIFFPKLEAVFYAAGTVKRFAEPFLKNGVRMFSAADANGIPVAEYTFAQILLANKGYFQATRKFRWPIWSKGFRKIRSVANNHSGNYHSAIGLLGCGSVGSKVAELLKSVDLEVLVYDPYLSPERIKELNVRQVGLQELFSTCDVISNHLPDIETTKGIIDFSLLKQMKPYATFINTGRGAQIIEKDLIRVLRHRKDLTALLDVTTHEPPFPWSGLYFLPNVFLTPHLAGSQNKEIDRMVKYVYTAYQNLLNGSPCDGEITLPRLKLMA